MTGLLYARGFLLVRHRIDVPVPGWEETQFADWWLYRDSRVLFQRSSGASATVLLVGRAILLEEDSFLRTKVAEHLVHAYEISRRRFDESVDILCGNYVLLAARGRDLSVQGDAAGLRSIFYSPEGEVIGSHASLVASQSPSFRPTEFHDPSWETGDSVSYLPGVRTIFQGVQQLTPNTELQLHTMTPRRVFPRRAPLSLEASEIVERLGPLFARQLDFLVGSGKELMLSVTGGIDSRTSLAVMRPVVDHLTAITYVLEFGRFSTLPIIGIDEVLASQITSALSIKHRIARISGPEVRPLLQETLQANIHHEHIWPLAQWYLDNVSTDTLHIRSNLYEIGKAFYRKGRPRTLPLTPEMMAETHRKSYRDRPAAVAAFGEFERLTDFGSLYGHDPYDFFYWEHRVGRWHGNVVAESDISHETWVLINSRRILELLLAAPLAHRVNATVFSRLIDEHWPALKRWPFNQLPSADLLPSATVSDHGTRSEPSAMSNNDRIAEVYKGEIWTDEAQERARRRIHWIASQARGSRVLDVGCSQGITSILLGREGFEVVGIDIEASRIEYASADLAHESEQTQARVTFEIGDGGELGFDDDSFDTVLLGEVIEHLVAPERVLAEAARVLRPGGVAVITTPFGFLHHHDHKQTFYPDDLFTLISQYLGIVSAEIGDRYFRIVGQMGSETEVGALDSLREQADKVVRGIQEELFDLRVQANRLTSELDKTAKSAATEQRRVAELKIQLSRSKARNQQTERRLETTERQRDNVREAWRETKAELAEIARDYRSIAADLEKATEQAETATKVSGQLRKARRRLAKRETEVKRLSHRVEVSEWKLASLRQRRWWRLGSELGEVRRRPRSLFTLPVRLVRVLRTKSPPLPRPELPESERGASKGRRVESPSRLMPPITPRHHVAALAMLGPELRRLLSHEFQLFDVDIASWQGQIKSLAPHLLIADASSTRLAHEDLTEILEAAGNAGITTVFWDEEPSETSSAIRARFDVIVGDDDLPTDSYTGRLVKRTGKVQPMIHNPVGSKRGKDSVAVDVDRLVLADTSYPTMSDLALASTNFKVLQAAVPQEASDLAALAAMATPIITPGGSSEFSLGASSEEEVTALERSLLKSEVLRARVAHPRMREAIRGFNIGSVVDSILGEKSEVWPLIDIMVATKRPEKLEFLFENLGRQTYPNFRVFLVAHGVQFDEEQTRASADRAGVRLAALIHVPESVILGEVFNIGFGETEADIVAKVDDDDIYGAEYLWDLYSALDFSGAEVAGKWAHYAYLEGPDTLVYRYPKFEHRFTDVVAISTLLMRRDVLEVERFPEMPWGSGSVFLRALGAQGGRVFAADRWNYLYVRGQDGGRNTFPISDLRLLSISDVVCRGMNVDEVVL